MPKKRTPSLRCPTCRKIVLRSEAEFPFCSERCRLIDLGRWASGGYVISSPITDPEDIEILAKQKADAEARSESRDQSNVHRKTN